MPSTTIHKYVVLGLQTLATLLALVLISFGIYVVVSYDLDEVGSLSAYAYVGLGVSAVVIVFCGYFSARQEKLCCSVTLTVLLGLVIVAQAVAVYLLFYRHDNIASHLSNPLEATWKEELKSPGAMSLYQNRFQCCGRSSPQDYIVNDRLPPDTCFRDHDKTKPENLLDSGCRVEFENYWLKLLTIFNVLACVLIGVELSLSVISCYTMRNDARRTYYTKTSNTEPNGGDICYETNGNTFMLT
ncbi:protein late bloomer-like [Drosophila bipectinata]|uniref:protein late bloomer-like n=1 Tax=Drosophila bipectinata TaxID=42026 RepID=UPI001C8ACF2F|nr:protein late bloomer-like [Drosophila bipectinata]